jgi:hypothetical protein
MNGWFLSFVVGSYGLIFFNLLNSFRVSTTPRHFDEIAVSPSNSSSSIDVDIIKVTSDTRYEVDSVPSQVFTWASRNDTLINIVERSPSVDYFSCCGAGHRFSKLSDSYYLAKQIGFGLRVFFGFCDNQEVFSYFFGPQPAQEVLRMTSRWNGTMDNTHLKVSNENPGFTKLTRYGGNSSCRCEHDRLKSDIEFFTGIRDRFRDRDRVDIFRRDHFVGKTVIGVHIRAGNGETGDFERKNRTIQNIDMWSESITNLLHRLSLNFTDPPILFLATDTSHIISIFKKLLQDVMPVVDLSQYRVDHGHGVLFGQRGRVDTVGKNCLNGWSDTFTDMMILSHADVVIAGRPSSFTQSIPMTMALAKPKTERKVLQSFCEVDPAATEMKCYEDLLDWCCNGVTDFSLKGIQHYDYRQLPRVPGLDLTDYTDHIKTRPNGSTTCFPKPKNGRDCLPYAMPSPEEVQQAIIQDLYLYRIEKWKQGMQP